jgi:hypothetical protein
MLNRAAGSPPTGKGRTVEAALRRRQAPAVLTPAWLAEPDE